MENRKRKANEAAPEYVSKRKQAANSALENLKEWSDMAHKITFKTVQEVYPKLSQLGAQIMQVVGQAPVEISVSRGSGHWIKMRSFTR